jgi:superfamily II DNA or RNA helicase
MNTYFGPKGYTVLKNELSVEMQKQIKKELTVSPMSLGGYSKDSIVFAYRETPQKLYLPYHYGVQKFGPPKQYLISVGKDIDVEFKGPPPRENQIPVLEKYLNHCKVSQTGGLLELHTGWGKTYAGIYLISQLKKKTAIVVQKEYLMDQWIGEIKRFLPDARIGRIQGPIIDVEDKDIVMCMLQSLVSKNKEYSQELLNEFGFTIIDEVHHMSSESFSKCLFKLVTRYMLGLSATMDRNDGTSWVFKMFMGEVIHKAVRETNMLVEVRAIQYKVDDDEFNETILDYRGKPQNSSMITKICKYNARTEFIIKTICDFIRDPTVSTEEFDRHKKEMDKCVPNCTLCNQNKHYLMKTLCCNEVKYCLSCLENVEQCNKSRPKCPNCNKVLKYEQHYVENKYLKSLEQTHVIIMAHNLSILHYIYAKMVCKNLANVGYYIGGMCQDELKKSEKKQVILASYTMCSEGLNIPSLNAEFLITPKTDVVQIVGRILRANHAYSHPIIYDFVDSHGLFQRQWMKRRAYFKKQNYKIVETTSKNYHTNYSDWKVIYTPKPYSVNKGNGKDDSFDEADDDDDAVDNAEEVCLLRVK